MSRRSSAFPALAGDGKLLRSPIAVVALFLLILVTIALPFLLRSSFSFPIIFRSSCSCSCPAAATAFSAQPIAATAADIDWLKSMLSANSLLNPPSNPEDWRRLRKGINPRTRAKQLADYRNYSGISHYDEPEVGKHIALPCPGELLVEEHHSNYGEPWAGGRDVFTFLATATDLVPGSSVLEVGCGTLRVGQHFIRFLEPGRYHCLERDELSLWAAHLYELPSQGLLHKRPLILRGEDMDFSRFGDRVSYDLIYASAVFLHVPDKLVWVAFERLAQRLKPQHGRIFVSHNIKFCTRLGSDECLRRLKSIGLEYVSKRMHDSLLFNHFEIWFEFKRQ